MSTKNSKKLDEMLKSIGDSRKKAEDFIKQPVEAPVFDLPKLDVTEPLPEPVAVKVKAKSKGSNGKHKDRATVEPPVLATAVLDEEEADYETDEDVVNDEPSNNGKRHIVLEQSPQALTPAEEDTEGMKSEVVKQLFDIPNNKILQRTELPRRTILPMSMQDTANYVLTGESAVVPQRVGEPRILASAHWMRAYGFLQLNVGRRIRTEGIATLTPPGEDMMGGDQVHM